MGWRDWPYWLKGGLIGGIVTLLVSLIFFAEWNYVFLLIYGSPLIIISFILSALIGWALGRIIKSNEHYTLQGLKTGFWVGVIFSLLTFVGILIFQRNMLMYPPYLGAITFVFSAFIIGLIIFVIISFITGKIKNRNQ